MSHFRNTVNPLLSSPGGLFFPSTFEAGGGGETGGLIHQRESKVSRGRTSGYRALYCFF